MILQEEESCSNFIYTIDVNHTTYYFVVLRRDEGFNFRGWHWLNVELSRFGRPQTVGPPLF